MKDFSFQFYPGDVLRETRFFTQTQKGCYLDILSVHIENIRFSYDLIMKITTELNESEKTEFMKIFAQDSDGFFIPWVIEAIEKRSNYIASRSKNKSGKVKNHMKNISTSYGKQIQIQKQIENKEEYEEKKAEKKSKKFTAPTMEEVTEHFKTLNQNGKSESLAFRFINFYESKGWMVGKSKMVNWKSAATRSLEWGETSTTKQTTSTTGIDYSQYSKNQ